MTGAVTSTGAVKCWGKNDAGRDAERLAGLLPRGASDTVVLAGDPHVVARHLGESAADVDVVLDYVWGEPAAAALVAVITGRAQPQ